MSCPPPESCEQRPRHRSTVADVGTDAPRRTLGRAPQPTRLLTWGVSGTRHGIDHAIRAIALLGERRREIRYLITSVGGVDPPLNGVDARSSQFTRLAWEAGVASSVRIDTTSRTPDRVAALVSSASVVILCDDASSAEHRPALAATTALGRPMIATASPHSADVFTQGAAIVVPYGDPVALAAAIITVVDEPAALQEMAARAARMAASTTSRGPTDRSPPIEFVSAALEPRDP